MTIELNGELANDRFGTPGGSIYFKYGYGSVAPGVYFDPATGGFTVMAWMKFVSISNHMRLIDFALNFDNNNVFVQIYSNKLQIWTLGSGVTINSGYETVVTKLWCMQ